MSSVRARSNGDAASARAPPAPARSSQAPPRGRPRPPEAARGTRTHRKRPRRPEPAAGLLQPSELQPRLVEVADRDQRLDRELARRVEARLARTTRSGAGARRGRASPPLPGSRPWTGRSGRAARGSARGRPGRPPRASAHAPSVAAGASLVEAAEVGIDQSADPERRSALKLEALLLPALEHCLGICRRRGSSSPARHSSSVRKSSAFVCAGSSPRATPAACARHRRLARGVMLVGVHQPQPFDQRRRASAVGSGPTCFSSSSARSSSPGVKPSAQSSEKLSSRQEEGEQDEVAARPPRPEPSPRASLTAAAGP